MSESPRWLLAHGRTFEARTILAQLTSSSATPSDEIVIAQSQEIEDAIALERKAAGDFRFMELFQGGEMQNLRRLCLCFGIQMMQQVCLESRSLRHMLITVMDSMPQLGGISKSSDFT